MYITYYLLRTCMVLFFCRSLTVAAGNEEEKERWIEDLNMAIMHVDASDAKMPYLSLKSCSK